MPDWGWTALKWTVALVVMAVVAYVSIPLALEQISGAVSFGDDTDDTPEPTEGTADPEETPTLEGGEVTAIAAVAASDGVVRSVGADQVTLGPEAADELLIAFAPLPTDPSCLVELTLQVQLLESGETSVHVQPARVPDLPSLADGASLPAGWRGTDTDPAPAFTSGAPGGLRWDARDVYLLAARAAEPGENVVLSVSLPESETPVSTTLATGAEVTERLPLIEWQAISGCATG